MTREEWQQRRIEAAAESLRKSVEDFMLEHMQELPDGLMFQLPLQDIAKSAIEAADKAAWVEGAMAPKGGVEFLAMFSHDGDTTIAYHTDESRWADMISGQEYALPVYCVFTHFQYLPEPPESEA